MTNCIKIKLVNTFQPGAAVSISVVLTAGAVLPEYKTAGAAGLDLCCLDEFSLSPMQRVLVPTGLHVAIPVGFEGQVRPRSGLAVKHGISMVNTPGTIDCDYRGEIKVCLINLGSEVVQFAKGERIGQIVFCPVARAEWQLVESLDGTARGEGGFGSTGS